MQRLQCGNAEEVEDELRLPSSVRITKDVAYEVVYIPKFEQGKSKYVTHGECRFDVKQIVISLDQSQTNIVKTFIHELFHCMEFENKIDIPHKAIHQLEHAVLKVLKLNGWMK